MSTIGSASPGSPHFPLESVVRATIRLVAVLAIAWGAIQLVLAIISTATLWWMFAAADSDTAMYGAAPTMVGEFGKSLLIVVWGVVLAVAAKRLTQFVTKGT